MQHKKFWTITIAGALAIAAVFGAVATRNAQAQEATPTTPSTAPQPGEGFGKGGPGGRPGSYTNEDLATALGLTTDELSAAQTAANQAALAQAVKDGLITQAQADELSANGSAFPFGGRWGGWLNKGGIDYQALLADELNITTEDLQAAYAKAYNTRIDQAVSDGTMSQEQADRMKGRYALQNDTKFQQSMQSAFEAAVAQAVTDGVITQAQADQILADGAGMGFHGMGGPGGGSGGGPSGFGGRGGH